MGEDERYCVACKEKHLAAAWYERETVGGAIEYLCGDEYTALKNKGTWRQVFPAPD
jgi:hypothetical protein